MKKQSYKIPKLSRTEIETLQVDKAMRQMGNLHNTLIEINTELGYAMSELGQASVSVNKLKADKSTVVELMRALKVMVQSG